MRILILGGDGYLGWPTAMYFSARGDDVMVVDNFLKRRWELELGVEPLEPVPTLHRRISIWGEVTGKTIEYEIGDICNHRFIYLALEKFRPDAIVHFGEQPSAPYSMQSREAAVHTQMNNVIGNLNLLFGIKHACPETHLVKLGTMGEYGTPNIDIEEGWLELEHNGRKDRVLFPKKPHSFYHLSKVHDSHNIEFACRIWGLRSTDLNQGVVYGVQTVETRLDPLLRTSFHYDDVFGTVLNRFLVQSAVGERLTIYGSGSQTRGFLNIQDTIACVELAVDNPAANGEYRVLNQFTQQFSISELAQMVVSSGQRLGIDIEVVHLPNPRVEQEEHYYNAKNTKLVELGLNPVFLTDQLLDEMLSIVVSVRPVVEKSVFQPRIQWHRSFG